MSSSNGGLFSSRRFSSTTSSSNDVPPDSEGFEIAVDMCPGEPLKFSARTLKEHIVQAEFALICRDPVDGIYTIPSSRNSSEWFGILFIRRGLYVGAVLRFTLRLPADFPTSSKLPAVIFDLDVYHPHIRAKSHELDLKRYFPEGWNSDKHHVYHVLLIVQRTFFTFDADPGTCVNQDAALLLKNDIDSFKERVRELVRKSRSVIYDPPPTSDPNAIRLSPWDASVHEPLRQRLIGGLTDSQISTMSMLGSLGYGPMGSSIFDSRGKAGFSWVSASEMAFMIEQPRPPELELKEISQVSERTVDCDTNGQLSTPDGEDLTMSTEKRQDGVGKRSLERLEDSATAHQSDSDSLSSSYRNGSAEEDIRPAVLGAEGKHSPTSAYMPRAVVVDGGVTTEQDGAVETSGGGDSDVEKRDVSPMRAEFANLHSRVALSFESDDLGESEI